MNILLVEDNLGDIELFREALSRIETHTSLRVIENGREAIDYLNLDQNNSQATPLPDIVLLDINLPGKKGGEILERIKNDSMLKHIPVIMMSSSISDQEVLEAYRLNANCFLLKQPNMKYFFEAVETFVTFWSRYAILPKLSK